MRMTPDWQDTTPIIFHMLYTQHKANGRHIRQMLTAHVTYVMYNTSSTLKICQNLHDAVLLYVTTDAVYDYGIFL